MNIPARTREALEKAGLPLPDPGRVLAVGYTAVEVQAIEKEYTRLEREYKDRGLDFWAQP